MDEQNLQTGQHKAVSVLLRIARILFLLLFLAGLLVFGGMLVAYLPMLTLGEEGAFLVEAESPVRAYIRPLTEAAVLRVQGRYLFAAALPHLIYTAMVLVGILWIFIFLRRVKKAQPFFTKGGMLSLGLLSVWALLSVALPLTAGKYAVPYVAQSGTLEMVPWAFAVPLGIVVTVILFTTIYFIGWKKRNRF